MKKFTNEAIEKRLLEILKAEGFEIGKAGEDETRTIVAEKNEKDATGSDAVLIDVKWKWETPKWSDALKKASPYVVLIIYEVQRRVYLSEHHKKDSTKTIAVDVRIVEDAFKLWLKNIPDDLKGKLLDKNISKYVEDAVNRTGILAIKTPSMVKRDVKHFTIITPEKLEDCQRVVTPYKKPKDLRDNVIHNVNNIRKLEFPMQVVGFRKAKNS